MWQAHWKKKLSPKIPKYCKRRDIDINEILRSKRLHFRHLEAISKSWLQVREVPILFLFGINLPLKKYLMKSFFFIKAAIAGSSLLRSLGWPKKRQRSGSARWGALCWIVVVICRCDLWLWGARLWLCFFDPCDYDCASGDCDVLYRMVLFYCSSHNMCKWWKESILFDCVNKKCSSSSSSCESGIRLIGGRRKKLWGEWKEYLHFLLNVFIGYKYIIGSKDFICWQFFLCLGISFYLFKVLHLFCEGGSNREASPTAELNFTWVVEDFRNQVKRISSSSK